MYARRRSWAPDDDTLREVPRANGSINCHIMT